MMHNVWFKGTAVTFTDAHISKRRIKRNLKKNVFIFDIHVTIKLFPQCDNTRRLLWGNDADMTKLSSPLTFYDRVVIRDEGPSIVV